VLADSISADLGSWYMGEIIVRVPAMACVRAWRLFHIFRLWKRELVPFRAIILPEPFSRINLNSHR